MLAGGIAAGLGLGLKKSVAGNQDYLSGQAFQPYSGPRGIFGANVYDDSKIYPGCRHWWGIYSPNPTFITSPPALMVFLDGATFAKTDGPFRTTIVLDNLIGTGVLPAMVCVFIAAGSILDSPDRKRSQSRQRSLEYDTLSTTYSDFLMTELLPLASKYAKWTDDPERRGIGGHSSGAICAFTVAWNHPEQFRKVYSANGSFTNIRGGDKYPEIIKAGPKRPLRVYQWSDANDMSNPQWGSWATANKAMASVFDEAGYDHLFEFGEGTHDPAFAAAHFPAALKWLWQKGAQEK